LHPTGRDRGVRRLAVISFVVPAYNEERTLPACLERLTAAATRGSMSGDAKRSDGLLGASDNERHRSQQAPPVLYATALVLDSTSDPPEVWCRGRARIGGR
jgi:hypothetical protein